MRRSSDYANHSARARTIAWALDLALTPLVGAPGASGATLGGKPGAAVGGEPGTAAAGDRVPLSAAPRAGSDPVIVPGVNEAPRRILLIRPDHAGDLLMATPAIRALRRAHPDAAIDLLASPWGAPAVAGNPDLDRVLRIEANWFEPGRREGPDPCRLIGSILALRFPGAGQDGRPMRDPSAVAAHAETRSTARAAATGGGPRSADAGPTLRYDAAADLRGDVRSILLARASGARRRVGFGRIGLERLLTESVPLDPRMDHVSRNHAVLRLLGAGPLDARRPVFVVPDRAEAAARALVAALPADRPIVTVHPGTNRPWASWGVDRFAEAVGLLAARRPISVVADGRAADHEAAARVASAAASRGATAIDLSGRTDFAEAAAIIRGSAVMLGNDSGAAHLAVAVGTPVVAIFGPTDPALFWTWEDRERNVALAGPSECARPCFRTHCPRDHGYDRVSPADVASVLERLLDDSARSPSRDAGAGCSGPTEHGPARSSAGGNDQARAPGGRTAMTRTEASS